MKDITIIIKDDLGRETKSNTNQIEENIIRMSMGLEPIEEYNDMEY